MAVLLLLASLLVQLLPVAGPCPLAPEQSGALPSLTRLHICSAAAYTLGSPADHTILRSESLLPLRPVAVRGEAAGEHASLCEGYPPTVYRPPRLAA
jgi:hypothetical protein